jgi:hypothetical protein
MRILDYTAFIGDHPHFLLLRTGVKRYNFIESRLASAGWRLTPIAISDAKPERDTLYQVDRQ